MPPVAIAVAEFVVTGIEAIGVSATIATAVGEGIVALGGGLGLMSAVGAWATVAGLASMFIHPHIGEAGTSHSPIDFKADPQAAVSYMVGRTANAGNGVYIASSGPSNDPPNNYLHMITAYGAGGPYHAFEKILINGTEVSFDGSGAATTSPYAGFLWLQTQLGDPTAGAMAQPSGTTGDGTLSTWTPAHKMQGIAGSWLIAKISSDGSDPYGGSAPAPLPVLQAALAYDPRKDSTQTAIGGSGSHRWPTDPTNPTLLAAARATWEFNKNPWVGYYNWALGIWEGDSHSPGGKAIKVLGIGAPPAALDVAAIMEAANIADANGWEFGATIYSTDSKWEALAAMAQAGGGIPIPLGGMLSCMVNTPRVSLATLTGDDVTDQASICLSASRKDRINQIIPTYRSEDHQWQQVEADPIRVDDYITADGELRSKAVVYPMVQCEAGDDPDQVAQLARYDIENAREGAPITIPARLSWLGYKPGDCLTINDPQLGLVDQKVLMMTREPDPQTGQLAFTFRTETDAKHALALAQTGTAPPIDPSDDG